MIVVTASIAMSCDVEVGSLLRGVWKEIDAPLLKSKPNEENGVRISLDALLNYFTNHCNSIQNTANLCDA